MAFPPFPTRPYPSAADVSFPQPSRTPQNISFEISLLLRVPFPGFAITTLMGRRPPPDVPTPFHEHQRVPSLFLLQALCPVVFPIDPLFSP